MSESFLERLSQFTPDPGQLDRDTLLFAAGRRSARPNRGWIALAASLASTQVLSLVLLWPQPAPPSITLPPPAAAVPSSAASLGPMPATSAQEPGLWSARHGLLEALPEDRPSSADSGKLMDNGPPLRAFGPLPPSILD
jgi:hypothetical protein